MSSCQMEALARPSWSPTANITLDRQPSSRSCGVEAFRSDEMAVPLGILAIQLRL